MHVVAESFNLLLLQFSAKVLELAREQRMNTDVRRNIFCIIMTSEDYLDAFEKLLRFVVTLTFCTDEAVCSRISS